MPLSYLIPLYEQLELPDIDVPLQHSVGLSPAARSVAIAALAARSSRPVLVVAARQDVADRLTVALRMLLPTDREPVPWAAPDPLPYEQLPHDLELSSHRVAVLDELLSASREGGAPVIVATVRALMVYLRSRDSFERDVIDIAVGQRIDDQAFMRRLVEAGYRVEAIADLPGTVSRRGGIIDVVSPGVDGGLRIEFFGDEVESLRVYDPASQRTMSRIDRARILPPIEFDLHDTDDGLGELTSLDLQTLRPEVRDEWTEILDRLRAGAIPDAIDLLAPAFPANHSMLADYLPENTLVVALDPGAIAVEAEQIELRAAEIKDALESAGEIPSGLRRPYATFEEVSASLARFARWEIGGVEAAGREVRTRESFVEPPLYAGDLNAMATDLKVRTGIGWRVVIATDQADRVRDLLSDFDIYPRATGPGGVYREPPPPGAIDVMHAPLEAGFALADPPTLVLSDREIFGIRKTLRPPVRPRRPRHRPARELPVGSYVVHMEHGVGIFRGLTTLDISGIEREYLQVDYADGDRLYVPVDQSDRLAPYEAPAGPPRITRLSSPEWSRTKSRVRRAVRDMAYELLQIYAARELAQGRAFPEDSAWDIELAESFPYQETPDQAKAIEDVKRDLESPRPMDRLVCGDVGYGKTEVALRAAFKVVNAGYQVAVLVPTTVLALQHYETFRDRLAAFPVNVEMLSRLRNRVEQRRILEALEAGQVDIVIGTHRLIQPDVKFHKLGLLIVDEEQRFGVRHKEYIKRQRAEIDVLTMTATPIPRTLYMALTSIRDLSLISTPPQERVPIRTFVTASDDTVVREAILREVSRGGQVFVVHNRVQSIYRVRDWIEKLVPEVSVGVGHGQMDERELEHVILAFMQREYDVLVCTTIIESGVDIPNANTIIIDQAHTLGLTQLYQLRGRVGRGSVRAYAYLLYPPNTPLSPEARARLAAIQEATELGAGFQIAMRDLEIRGAGNILGAEQSGHIAAVGLDLYTRMLSHAVEEIRAGRPIVEPEEVNIDIAVDGRIPEEYISDESIRLSMYHRIASAKDARDLADVRAELIDRFGPVPDETNLLFDLVRLRHRASDLGITTLIERDGEIYIRPVVGGRLDQARLRSKLGQGVRVTPNQVRLMLNDLKVDRNEAIKVVLDAVEEVRASVMIG